MTDFTTYHWSKPYIIDSNDNDITTSASSSTVADLPNWWYSLALSHYLTELDAQRKQSYTTGTSNSSSSSSGVTSDQSTKGATFVVPGATSRHAVSSFMLKCALYKYPFMLIPLLSKAGVTVGMFANSTWKPVLNHSYFANAINSVPSQSIYLRNICTIYSSRVGAMWNTPEIHIWVLEAAKEVLTRVDTESSTSGVSSSDRLSERFRLSCKESLSQYASATLEEFTEEVVRMPNELNNLIDPQLMDPRILAGGVRFNAEQLGVELPRNRPRMNRFEREQLEQRQREERSYYLDLTMPLMELFFATLVPWYRLPGTVISTVR